MQTYVAIVNGACIVAKSTKDASGADKECDAASEECDLADFTIHKEEGCQKPKCLSGGGLLPMTTELRRIAVSTVMCKAQVTCACAMVVWTFYKDLRFLPLLGTMRLLSQGVLSKYWSRGTVNAIFLAAIGAQTIRFFGRWS